jgi:hypothetical protein
MSHIAKKTREMIRKAVARALKIWKKIFRMKKSINPKRAAMGSTTRIRDPVKKSFIMLAMTYL